MMDPLFGHTPACRGEDFPAGIVPSLRDVHSPNSTRGRVYRARETVRITVVAPARIEGAPDCVIAARPVAGIQVRESDVADAVLLIRPFRDGVLARTDGVVRRGPVISIAQSRRGVALVEIQGRDAGFSGPESTPVFRAHRRRRTENHADRWASARNIQSDAIALAVRIAFAEARGRRGFRSLPSRAVAAANVRRPRSNVLMGERRALAWS